VAISMSLVLTYSFIRSQSVHLQINENSSRTDWAIQAAQTGAAVAIERIQSTDWLGVDETLSREVHADNEGTAYYEVIFNSISSSDLDSTPAEASFMLAVESTGFWASAKNPDEIVERRVEVIVRLKPRLPGRTIRDGDSDSASDLISNPGDYDQIQSYALFASGGDKSLVLDPADRIDGAIWLKNKLQVYGDPRWSSSVRDEFLADIGARFATVGAGGPTYQHPHPLAGSITFYQTPANSVQQDLGNLGVAWNKVDSQPEYPTINYSDYENYQIYAGGFVYSAVDPGSRIDRKELRPTEDNPLGIFFHRGDVSVDDDVIIQGTLVSTGKIAFHGDHSHLSSFNWKDDSGIEVLSESSSWRRLPAIVAYEVDFHRHVQVSVHGAIVTKRRMKGAGGSFGYENGNQVSIVGTATALPGQQPYSVVRLIGSPDLALLNGRGDYAIWLQDGESGSWYEIVGIDSLNHQLTIAGEVTHTAATNYLIRLNRKLFVDLHGPVSGESHDINRLTEWEFSESLWSDLYSTWEDDNRELVQNSQPEIRFTEWLETPANFTGWPEFYRTYGLNIEPTFHLRHKGEIEYHWSPPFFEPYVGTGDLSEFSGFRWEILSWQEIQ